MLPKLYTLHQTIEKQKAEMLAHLEALTEEEQNTQPSATDWSPLQVMQHVVIVEEWMAGPNKALPPANGRVLLKGHLFIILGGVLIRSGMRMPTMPLAEPHGRFDFTAIKQRWENTRNMLSPKLAAVTQEAQSLPFALHPAVGPLNAKQALELLDMHLGYHLRRLPHGQRS